MLLPAPRLLRGVQHARRGCLWPPPATAFGTVFDRFGAEPLRNCFWGAPGPQKHVISTPRGPRKSCSRLGAVLVFSKSRFFAWNPSCHASGTLGEPILDPILSPGSPLGGHTGTHISQKRGPRRASQKKRKTSHELSNLPERENRWISPSKGPPGVQNGSPGGAD